MNDDLEVMLHGEAPAALRRTRSGRLELCYHEPDGAALSLSMPRRRNESPRSWRRLWGSLCLAGCCRGCGTIGLCRVTQA